MPANHFSRSGLHGCLGPVPTSVAAGDRLLGRSWKCELGLPASTAETSLGAAGLPSASQQKLRVYGDHKIYACVSPSTSALPAP